MIQVHYKTSRSLTFQVQMKDCEIGVCWFSAKHAALRSNSNDWFNWNQVNMSEWSDICFRRLLFQRTRTQSN